MPKLTREILKDEKEKLNILQKNIEEFLSADKYIFDEDLDEFKNQNRYKLVKLGFTLNIFLYFNYMKYKRIYNEIRRKIKRIGKIIFNHNESYINAQKEVFNEVCGKVEEKILDDEQIDAIVREDRNQLVIAGAGCGKTTTIVGKVKYLVKVKNIKPEEILLLSFTRKSASDMKKRVESEIGQNMECYTFHKLGLDITKKQLKNVDVYEDDIRKFIKEQLSNLIKDDNYLEALVFYLIEQHYIIKDDFVFKTREEFEISQPITIKDEVVKSFGEMIIANFLFSNNIKYEYERDYKFDTETNEYRQYKPDFYLPDYDIYIEYFGIDRDGNVPDYYESRHGKSPKEEYNEGIIWKKNIHKENNTKLIELYYYENKEGTLKEKLEKELLKNGVELKPKSTKEIFDYIVKNNNDLLNTIVTSFATVINLIKSNNESISDLRDKAEYEKYRDNIMVTLDLIEPILDKYDEYLAGNNMIDFNDMINVAISTISSGLYINKYKYVIVDEFQDISNSRYKLLHTLRNTQDYKLYCVGDDWQSIYRFSGSDIGIFTNFEKYFGKVKINLIENTHRFSSKLAEISGYFIMKNPNQIKKNLHGVYLPDFPLSEVEGYTLKYALGFIEEKLDYLEENSTISFLGRYNHDVDIVKSNDNFILKYNKEKEIYTVIYKKRKDLKIEFMTVHKSKGLEADYIVLLNTKENRMGFPCRIIDLPVTKLLLDNSDDYPYSEERRLFYVAMTRARKKVFFLTEKNNKSFFIKGLLDVWKDEFKKEKNSCPKCGKKLNYIEKNDKRFWICSDYENCKYIKNLPSKK